MSHPQIAPTALTYSQRHGLSPLPQLSPPGELPQDARTAIWNVLYVCIVDRTALRHWSLPVLKTVFLSYFREKINHYRAQETLRRIDAVIESGETPQVLDLVEMILRHPASPRVVQRAMAGAFENSCIAYRISLTRDPTIVPISNEEMAVVTLAALANIERSGSIAATSHLKTAMGLIRQGDHPGAIRESVHAVESLARGLSPGSESLSEALTAIEKNTSLHPALRKAMTALYGYASDEQGVRHALLDQAEPNVEAHEASLVFGVCSVFCGYLAARTIE